MSKPPFDLAAVDEATKLVLEKGERMLHTHSFADTPRMHTSILLGVMNPKKGAVILDAGCGVGELALIMNEQRSDLVFVLANISALQLRRCPLGMQFIKTLCDFHDLPLDKETVDVVMFNSSLVQMDERTALAQAMRVLKPGGTLLINELVRLDGDGKELEERLACRTLRPDDLMHLIYDIGFDRISPHWLKYQDSLFRGLLRDMGWEHLLNGTRPLVITARKPG